MQVREHSATAENFRAFASPARLEGYVDVAALRADVKVAIVRRSESMIELSAPGLSIRLEKGAADWHVDGHLIVLVLGTPQLAGHRVSAMDLAASAKDDFSATKLGGRYAVAVIDVRGRTIRLQTDRFGVQPLCWGQEGTFLAFADRADCVVLHADRAVDPQGILNYVYFHVIPGPRTIFRGVSRLEPATQLLFSGSGLSFRAVWRPEFSQQRRGNLADLSARFREAVRDSVAFEADQVAVGCYLSGGTDSSTVAGMLKRVTGRAATFSIGFDQPGYDEMDYARIAARHFGTEHHEHYVTPTELVDAVPIVAAHYDQPFGNSSAVPAFICARLAHGSGVRKLLAGDGGDELFGGNRRYAKQKVFEVWWSLPSALRGAVAPFLANRLTRRLPLARKVASYVSQAQVPMPARLETYNLLNRLGPARVFEPGFLDLVDLWAPYSMQSEVYARTLGAPFVDRMLAYDWRFTLADNDLPKVCGTAELAGIEVGFPLLADALVDLSMQLSPRDKVRGLRLRHFFKQSLTEFLPPEIIAKKKHGFGLPVGSWLVSDSALRNLAHDSLSALANRRLIRPTLVQEIFSKRLDEHAGYYGEMIWVLMQLELWLEARVPAWRLG
jgi:asparagine synthase (glutamine-hydrolysing)